MIDMDQISEEYIKCFSDKSRTYMIEHYLKTFDMQKGRDVPFLLLPRQKDLIQAFRDYRRNIVTKPRQAGITTTAAGFIACEIALSNPESPQTVLIVGRDFKLSQNLLDKIEKFLRQIPRWFWGEEYFSTDPKSQKNKKDIFVTHNKQMLELFNGCKVYAVSSGPNAARGISSVSWLIFDEAAFIENGLDVYAQAIATTSTGGKTIMISTPYGKDLLYYGIYNKALQGKNDFHITELRWYQDPRYNKHLKWVLKDEDTNAVKDEIIETALDSEGNVAYTPERWKELEKKGYKPWSPWYESMCNAFNNDSVKIAQELDVSFVGSSNNVIDPQYIDMQKTMNVKEPDPELKDRDLEEVWIWKMPIEGHRYLMAIDNSRGDADDSTALEIIDMDGIDDDGKPCIEQVMEYSGKLYGDTIGELANIYGRMYNDAFCVVESIGGYGDATLLTLMNLKYPNLYFDDVDLKTYTAQNRTTAFTPKDGKLPGFHTSSTRFQMLSNFSNLVKTNQFKIRSTRVIAELETWIWKNGRQDHMDGFHDDTITCLAMGLFVMQFSMNRQIEAKTKDEAILKAMISANSRIICNPHGNNMQQNGKYMPIYQHRESLSQDKAAQYKAYMWLVK